MGRGDSAVLRGVGLGLAGMLHIVGIIRGTNFDVLVDELFLAC